MQNTLRATVTLTPDRIAELLRDAAAAHHTFEEASGVKDPDWPKWYADHIFNVLAPRVHTSDAIFVGMPNGPVFDSLGNDTRMIGETNND